MIHWWSKQPSLHFSGGYRIGNFEKSKPQTGLRGSGHIISYCYCMTLYTATTMVSPILIRKKKKSKTKGQKELQNQGFQMVSQGCRFGPESKPNPGNQYSRRSAAGSARTKATRCHKRKCRCCSRSNILRQIRPKTLYLAPFLCF